MEQNFCVSLSRERLVGKANSQRRWCSHRAMQSCMDAQWELGCHVDVVLIIPLIHFGLNMEVPDTTPNSMVIMDWFGQQQSWL